MNGLIYGIKDTPKTIKEWILYSLQQVLAVFVATVLIANICGTPVSSCLLGACLGTLVYQIITGFRSPIFISSCGATVSAVLGALSLNAAGNNYLMVFCGGLIILAIYGIFALIIKWKGIDSINKIFPPALVGSVTMVIGLNLATFIVGYTNLSNFNSNVALSEQINFLIQPQIIWSMVIAIITMLVTALISHYGKGFIKNIPFLFGLGIGFIIALIVTLCGVKIVDFSAFDNLKWYPDLTFLKWSKTDWSFSNLLQTTLYFVPVAICALLEHYSDSKALSNIINTDLTKDPGLHKTLLGDGVASALGTAICGLPNTSYGESIATIGFSKVASVWVITAAAAFLGLLSFVAPVSAFIQTIPSCVFGGCAMILYGFIAVSGLKTILNSNIDLNNTKNLLIISVVLTVGVSGIKFLVPSFGGVALAMILGVILNLILKEK